MAKVIQCGPGNKRCGKRCVPNKHKCKGEKESKSSRKFDKFSIDPFLAAGIAIGVAGLTVSLMHSQQKRDITESKKELWDELLDKSRSKGNTRTIKVEINKNKNSGDLFEGGTASEESLQEDSKLGGRAFMALTPDGKGTSFAAAITSDVKGRLSQEYNIDESLLDVAVAANVTIRMVVPPPEKFEEFLDQSSLREFFDDENFPGACVGNTWIINPKAPPEVVGPATNELIAYRTILEMGELPFNDIHLSNLPGAMDEEHLSEKAFGTKQRASLVENARYFAKHGKIMKELFEKYEGTLREPGT